MWVVARIVLSNWKYSRLYNVGVHEKILENFHSSFRLPLERFDEFMLRFINWATI